MMQIFENSLLVVTKQIRFPRSKKRRVQKKWRKRSENHGTIPDRNCIIAGDRIYCHPVVASALRATVKEQAIIGMRSGLDIYGPGGVNYGFL